MNKKFFTLIAGVAMLAGLVGTANAAPISIKSGTVPSSLDAKKKYQLAITTKEALDAVLPSPGYAGWYGMGNVSSQSAAAALYATLSTAATVSGSDALWYGWIDKDGYIKGDPAGTFTGEYYESIFCVNYTRQSDGGQAATLDITNWANQTLLLIDPADVKPSAATALPALNARSGILGNWGYAAGYGNNQLQHWVPLFIYVPGTNNSEVYVFVADWRSPNKVGLQRIPANNLHTNALPAKALLVEFIEPAPVVLNAAAFNTRLGSFAKATAQKLTFWGDKDAVVNTDGINFIPSDGYAPWKDVNILAEDVADQALVSTPNTDSWLYFIAKEGTDNGKYLRLDTSYYGAANDNLKFAWGTKSSAYVAPTFATVAAGNTVIKDKDGKTWLETDTNGLHAGIFTSGHAASDFINQYRFQATYFWSNDSIAIDIAQATFKPEKQVGHFYETASTTWTQPYYELVSVGGSYTSNAAADAAYLADKFDIGYDWITNGDLLHIRLLDLVKGQTRVLTVGDRPIQTRIKFGMQGCQQAPDDRISIPEGVYIIRNAARNLILQVPIYGDSTNSNAIWVTPKPNVDPMRIPAYQWIVKKTSTSDPDHSPITITNREFPLVKYDNVRIYKTGSTNKTLIAGETIANTYSTKADWNHSDRSFQHVNPALLKDKYLGYYHVDDATAKISKFDLNYLNQFLETQIYFINKQSKDSMLAVSTARDLQFTFIPQSAPRAYGYVPTVAERTSLGIDTLYRVAYEITTRVYENNKPVTKKLVVNKENRYALSSRPENFTGSNGSDSAIFLFKANNWAKNVDGTEVDFYALLDTTSYISFLPNYNIPGNLGSADRTGGAAGAEYDLRYVKIAVADEVPWVHVGEQRTPRTSAFAVTSYTPPLYRRFDNGKYKAFQNELKEVTEPYGAKNDAPLYLKFTRQNNYGYEFLAENSPKGLGNNNPGGVGASYDTTKATTTGNDYRQQLTAYGAANTSFLGYYNKGQYPEQAGKLSFDFYVDTAYSRRPAIGSNSSAFTPKPQYMLALRAQYYPNDTILYDGSGEWHYPDGTPVPGLPKDTTHRVLIFPAFTTGYYLYNAQDSVNVGRADFEGKVGYGGQLNTRLAFVRGFHAMATDSFYVVPNGIVNGIDYRKLSDIDIISNYQLYLREKLPLYLQHSLRENTHYEQRWDGANGTLLVNNTTDNIPYYNGKAMVFQFRLIKDELGDRRFIIESETGDDSQQYGPDVARWLRIENGVPFLTDYISFYEASNDPHNGADIFNVEKGDGVPPAQKDQATANEAAATAAPKVIGGAGSVTILNAAGKTITVTNVLGQTIATSVATGNSQTIALPKGIVVVSIDGASSKALVK